MKIEQLSHVRQLAEALTQRLTARIQHLSQRKQEQTTGRLAVRTHLQAGVGQGLDKKTSKPNLGTDLM